MTKVTGQLKSVAVTCDTNFFYLESVYWNSWKLFRFGGWLSECWWCIIIYRENLLIFLQCMHYKCIFTFVHNIVYQGSLVGPKAHGLPLNLTISCCWMGKVWHHILTAILAAETLLMPWTSRILYFDSSFGFILTLFRTFED